MARWETVYEAAEAQPVEAGRPMAMSQRPNGISIAGRHTHSALSVSRKEVDRRLFGSTRTLTPVLRIPFLGTLPALVEQAHYSVIAAQDIHHVPKRLGWTALESSISLVGATAGRASD